MKRNLYQLLITTDASIILLHLIFGTTWSLFHLDHEANIPTYYQSLKLIFGFILLGYLNLKQSYSKEMRLFSLSVAVILLFLGLDELFQIHENIYRLFEFISFLHPNTVVPASLNMGYRSSLWIIYYIPIIVLFMVWVGYWIRYFQTSVKSNFRLIVISLVSLCVVLMSEVVSSTGTLTPHLYFWMVTIEETAEMVFATTLFYVALKSLKKHHLSLRR